MPQEFSVDGLVEQVQATFDELPDARTGKNTVYEMKDAALSAFSVFFTQSASFLAHQQEMERTKGCNNARSLFGVERIPSDPQIRNMLDPVAPEHVYAPFWWVLDQLPALGREADFVGVNGDYLLAMDGTQYFSSYKIHCENCSQRENSKGTLYTHTVLTPVLVGRDHNHVLALAPEFIMPQDGAEKQDCERNAAKRWIDAHGDRFAPDSVTILADDLHCHQAFCQKLLAHQINFILVCKPSSHPGLYEEVELLSQAGAVQEKTQRRWNGRHHEIWRYRWINSVPLRLGEDALMVNWCEITITHAETGERLYYNTFVTNHLITSDNVAEITLSGRARWKVENENNNVLKRYGYHLEHNFGHGDHYLSMTLLVLNLLAFLFHTVLHLTNRKYQILREELKARRTFFQDIRTLSRYMCFQSWEHLFDFMIQGLELTPPPD
jgi:hypothetical protein